MTGQAEVALINDGDGIAVIGDSTAVERWLARENIPSQPLDLPRLSRVLSTGGATTQAAADVAANSGRWIKLSEKSAQALANGTPMKGSQPGLSRAILTENGRTSMILEYAKTPGAMLSNPAVLTGAAGLMAQMAMQQTMSEITDYLERIDAKLDDVLKGQRDAVVADLIGVGLMVDEAMTVREGVGRVSEVTWSKVQATTFTIARTQAYALTQIEALTTKVGEERRTSALANAAEEARANVNEWLVVLARCVQLQEAVGVLELDRVLESSPQDWEPHRLALQSSRRDRLARITQTTDGLLSRLDEAVTTANKKVLTNPIDSRNVVRASTDVATQVAELHAGIGIEHSRDEIRARRWAEAAAEARDRAVATGARGVGGVRRARSAAADRLKDWRSDDKPEGEA